jgi:acyl carrier protein
MTKQERVDALVEKAIKQLNETRSPDEAISAIPGSPLRRPNGPLDSLGIVDLMMSLEVGLEDEFGITISLAETAGLPGEQVLFDSVDTLRDGLLKVVAELPGG